VVSTELGHRGPAPRCSDDPHNRLYHLVEAGLVVAVECRINGGGWRAGVIASRKGIHPGHIELSATELAAATTTIEVDPVHDLASVVLLWQSRVCQRSRGGHVYQVARTMAESLRQPGTLAVDLDADGARRLTLTAHLRPPALRIVLTRLIEADLLRPESAAATIIGTYELTCPELEHFASATLPAARASRTTPW
jgi:hypothetical protein